MRQPMLIAEWGWAEYRVLAGAAIGVRGRELERLAEILGPMFAGRPLHLVNQGRLAIEVALRIYAERTPPKPEVIVPAYICPSVLRAVERSGLVPVPVDVRGDLNLDPEQLAQAITPRTLAVIAAHMYACPAAIEEIERICFAAGVGLIDDAAQVLGVSAGGRPLGCFGHFGIASFSEVKSVTAGATNAGGALIVNDGAFERAAHRAVEALPQGAYRPSDFLAFLEDGPLHRSAAALRYRFDRLRRLFGGSGKRRPRVCPPSRMSNAAAAVVLQQLESFPSRRAGRIRLAAAYQRVLSGSGIVMPQYASGRYLTRMMVLLPEPVEMGPLRAALSRQGLETRQGYALGESNRKALRSIPDLDRRLLELPNRSSLGDAEVEWICATLMRTLSKSAAPPRFRSGPVSASLA